MADEETLDPVEDTEPVEEPVEDAEPPPPTIDDVQALVYEGQERIEAAMAAVRAATDIETRLAAEAKAREVTAEVYVLTQQLAELQLAQPVEDVE